MTKKRTKATAGEVDKCGACPYNPQAGPGAGPDELGADWDLGELPGWDPDLSDLDFAPDLSSLLPDPAVCPWCGRPFDEPGSGATTNIVSNGAI